MPTDITKPRPPSTTATMFKAIINGDAEIVATLGALEAVKHEDPFYSAAMRTLRSKIASFERKNPGQKPTRFVVGGSAGIWAE